MSGKAHNEQITSGSPATADIARTCRERQKSARRRHRTDFDHLVGAGEQLGSGLASAREKSFDYVRLNRNGWRYSQANCLCRAHI